MANDDGKSFARLAADEWRANLRRNRADAGPQGRTACGTVSADGYCMSRTHSMACADTMTSAVSRATFAVPGSAEADRLWVAAKAERERTVAMFRSPAEAAAMAERDRQAAEAEAARDRRAAEGDTVANWAASGRGIGWLAQTLAHGTR